MDVMAVAGQSVFRIRACPGPDARQTTVAIAGDDAREWVYQVAGWRPLCVGWGCGLGYLWSARDLIVLPDAPGEDPVVLTADEGLLVVFRTGPAGSWCARPPSG
jgi:hypothetical protein